MLFARQDYASAMIFSTAKTWLDFVMGRYFGHAYFDQVRLQQELLRMLMYFVFTAHAWLEFAMGRDFGRAYFYQVRFQQDLPYACSCTLLLPRLRGWNSHWASIGRA